MVQPITGRCHEEGKANEILERKIQCQNLDCTDFSCINLYKLEMMPDIDAEVLFTYL